MSEKQGIEPIVLSNSTLSRLPHALARPSYDRRRIVPGIVHIGVGGFNRSHLAVYLDDLLERGEANPWGEFGIGLLPADKSLHDALALQDCLYGLMLMDSGGESYRVIGSLSNHVYAPDSREVVLARLSSPECRIISLTVTEGGYFIDGGLGTLPLDHSDLRHDLSHPETPRTWLGYVAEAANRRMRQGSGPFTLLSCDNLQHNGATARAALLAFAGERSPALCNWIESNVATPNSMVDRITPRSTDEHRATIAETFGIFDRAPVVAEPFRQWVLEDSFAAGRPAWELTGVQFTTDVAPYERTKMRLLNGGHSAIGYAADLLGISTISEAVSDPLVRELLIAFMSEVRPTLRSLPGIDLDDYIATILRRFSNTAIRDQVPRICSDGCAKIAKFLVPSLEDLLVAGADPQIIPLVIALWLHYLRGYDENGRAVTISDPLLNAIKPSLITGGNTAEQVFAVRSIFGGMRSRFPSLAGTIQTSLDGLRACGVRATIAKTLERIQAP